jgi:hypothetical protein
MALTRSSHVQIAHRRRATTWARLSEESKKADALRVLAERWSRGCLFGIARFPSSSVRLPCEMRGCYVAGG